MVQYGGGSCGVPASLYGMDMELVGGAGSPAGVANDVIYWRAGKSWDIL